MDPARELTHDARVRALSIHADYRCQHSGACCSSGWPIEVDPPAARRIQAGLAEGRLRPPPPLAQAPAEALLIGETGLPHGASYRLGWNDRGSCVFFDEAGGKLCAVHRDLGPDCLPSACRHFPRVALLASSGVSMSLSHFCPTAAGLLFREHVPLEIVTSPAAFPAEAAYEGLDARGQLPPLLREGVLLGWQAHERWEAHLVALFARADTRPEPAVAGLQRLARIAAAWSLERGPFDAWFEGLLREEAAAAETPRPSRQDEAQRLEQTRLLWEAVASATAPGLACPPFPSAFGVCWDRYVAPVWERYPRVVNRYLAARGFASWCALQGPGLRTTARALAASLAVLQVECVLRGRAREAPLDAGDLLEALRASDLRLLHHAQPEALAAAFSAAETEVPERAARRRLQ